MPPTLKQFKELERNEVIDVLIDIIKELNLKELKSMSILAAPFGFWADDASDMPPLERNPDCQDAPVDLVIEDGQWTESEAYIHPPRVKDAERFWPFMRCKNVVRLLKGPDEVIPRSHSGLLDYIAKKFNISVDTLKQRDPRILLKNTPAFESVSHAILGTGYWTGYYKSKN